MTTPPTTISRLDMAKTDAQDALRAVNEKYKQLAGSMKEPTDGIANDLALIEGDAVQLLAAIRSWRNAEARLAKHTAAAAARASAKAAKLRAAADKIDGGAVRS